MQHCLDAMIAELERRGPAGVRLGFRVTGDGDAGLLLPAERASIRARDPTRLRQSGAARSVARRLLRQLGCEDAAIPRAASGAPVWPAGFVGSMAHDDALAVAVVAPVGRVRSVGIDVEPAMPLPEEVEDLAVTPRDRCGGADPRLASRLLFCAKEAVFKAVFPLDGEVLGFEDVCVDLQSGLASVPGRSGIGIIGAAGCRVLALACVEEPRIRAG